MKAVETFGGNYQNCIDCRARARAEWHKYYSENKDILVHCDVCNRAVRKLGMSSHKKTRQHKDNLEMQGLDTQ